MKTINELRKEALQFRELLNNCDKSNTELVIDCFPIMSCKLSSMLLAYHFLKKWPNIELKGVSAATGKGEEISHYWLEIDHIVIDITGDQYNMIDDCELNKKIIKSRPFPSVHVELISNSYLYNLFKIKEKEILTSGFPDISTDFIEKMEIGYNQLLAPKTI
ncbi:MULTISPECIES: hypothetical protein [Providencia]|uniref:hypothetical protein n=1 Tax=Providencia TaxID=586 RepID=UPI0018C624ED|nr:MULTISPECIES: hypothetical protein [Providencia]MBG5894502.1 hypothetical protein [Providencia rettgeri]